MFKSRTRLIGVGLVLFIIDVVIVGVEIMTSGYDGFERGVMEFVSHVVKKIRDNDFV